MSENNNSIGMNELVDYKRTEYTGFRKYLTQFLWRCAGVDKQILDYTPYYDHVKYAGIGGIVLATGFLAFISMSFAIWYIFNSIYISLGIGLVWGLIIFNLDRFIISGTGKGDGKENIGWREIWPGGVIRIVMATLLGFTISAPLEVYIFQKEIDKQFYKIDQEEQKAEIKKIEKIYTKSPDFNKLNADKLIRETKIVELEKERENYQKLAANENTTERGGCGPKCQKFELMANGVLDRITEQQQKIKIIDIELERFNKEKKDKISKLSEVNNSSHGLLDRVLALERIPGSSVPTWLVRLMFVIIEVAPILFKMMLVKSSYDWMQENVAQILEAKQGISLREITDENNNMHRYRENYNAIRIAEVAKHQNDLEKDNAKHAMSLYAAKEKEEIDKDPNKFINND
jgi:hypothetical protein